MFIVHARGGGSRGSLMIDRTANEAWRSVVRDFGMAARWTVGAALAFALGGCLTIPAYDGKTDEMLTALQSSTDTLVGRLSQTYDASSFAAKPCAYSSNGAAFQALRVSIAVLTTRAGALYDNAATLKALGDLKLTYDAFDAEVKTVEQTRPDHCVLPQLLEADQRGLDSAVGAVLKLELAKKGSK